jgi:hypothetical protein
MKRQQVFAWAVETSTSGDIEQGAGDGEKNPPAIKSAELWQRGWGIRREEYRRCVSSAGLAADSRATGRVYPNELRFIWLTTHHDSIMRPLVRITVTYAKIATY